jgi:RNA polymerase sigma factor (sigma-70 family)
MSEGSSGFQDLMDQIAGGSESAVERLLGLYGDHLCRAVRRRLNRALRPKFGTSDFVQSVWASFFRDRSQLSRFRRSSELIAFLTRVANNKVVDEYRRRLETQKANVNRERSMSDDAYQDSRLPCHDPTPSQAAIADEEWARMQGAVPSQYRAILELRAAGETHEEIARRLGVNEKTIRRVLGKLRTRLERGK